MKGFAKAPIIYTVNQPIEEYPKVFTISSDIRLSFPHNRKRSSQEKPWVSPMTYEPLRRRPIREVQPVYWPRAPNSWSEVVFATWRDFCSQKRIHLSTLKYVGQIKMLSPATLDVMRGVWEETPEARNDAIYSSAFTPIDMEFFVLLSSPDAIDVVKLLSSYPNAFATRGDPQNRDKVTKVKTIEQVKLAYRPPTENDRGEWGDLVFVLADVDPPHRV